MSETASPYARNQLDRAILKTVLYSDLFDYVLTPGEIAHYLMESGGNEKDVRTALSQRSGLGGQLVERDGYVMLPGRESLAEKRRERRISSGALWQAARVFSRALSRMPFVRMVAVTGALAMDNSSTGDDIDVLVVSSPGRVWLCRAFVILVVRLGRLTRRTLCPNYVLSQDALDIGPKSIYVAHEFMQMVPTFGTDVYLRMRAANQWASYYLPNASRPLHQEAPCRPGAVSRSFKRALEWALSGRIGDRLEAIEMKRKVAKLSRRKAGNAGSVILNGNQVKGHFDDHGTRISSLFVKSLEKHGLPGECADHRGCALSR